MSILHLGRRYTGFWWESGTLLRGKMHVHNTVFEDSYVFSATPADVGLGDRKFHPENAYEPIPTKRLGFATNTDLRRHIMESYRLSCARYVPSNKDNGRPELVCHGNTSHAEVGGFLYDRRAPTYCAEFKFMKGQQFVILGLNRHTGRSPGPHLPPGYIPAYLPGHLHWFWSWIPKSEQERSRYTYGIYSTDPIMALGTPSEGQDSHHGPM